MAYVIYLYIYLFTNSNLNGIVETWSWMHQEVGKEESGNPDGR